MQSNGTGFSDYETGNMKFLSNVVGLCIATIEGQNKATKI
jgi:hypothetical protein